VFDLLLIRAVLNALLRSCRTCISIGLGIQVVERALSGRIVVVSPHLDDAVLSLGGAIARPDRLGTEWMVVTVFAGDPESKSSAGRYDNRCGFFSAGEAASARRREDEQACATVGARPVWLPFGGVQYERVTDADAVWAALEPHVKPAQILLLPGFPLVHRDHAWVTKLVLARAPESIPIGFYAEQPYAHALTPAHGRHCFVVDRPVQWVSLHAGIAERLIKGRACRAYWSQFRTLGCHLPFRCLLPEVFWTNERLGWPGSSAFESQFGNKISA
jgi:LmbE family N-acetylglucosaminyl deacetylase